MKTVISKLDNKKYFLTVSNFDSKANKDYSFIEGRKYQVRKATAEDIEKDFEDYCVVNGTFWSSADEFSNLLDKNAINSYNGTTVLHLLVKKSVLKNNVSYIAA